MDLLTQALQGANQRRPAALGRLQSALVVGAGGELGSALLAEALAAGRFRQVTAIVTAVLTTTVRGLRAWTLAQLQGGQPSDCELAFVVFQRDRRSNGRDDAFHRPEPGQVVDLARSLHAIGVRRLIVVVPHAPALLPQALKGGFASLDEGRVAALGFEHLVFIRSAQDLAAAATGSVLERFAAWWLSQLKWMIPQREQPLRAQRMAQLAVQLARCLPAAPPGTRVLPPEVLWQAAQAEAPDRVLEAWLSATRP